MSTGQERDAEVARLRNLVTVLTLRIDRLGDPQPDEDVADTERRRELTRRLVEAEAELADAETAAGVTHPLFDPDAV